MGKLLLVILEIFHFELSLHDQFFYTCSLFSLRNQLIQMPLSLNSLLYLLSFLLKGYFQRIFIFIGYHLSHKFHLLKYNLALPESLFNFLLFFFLQSLLILLHRIFFVPFHFFLSVLTHSYALCFVKRIEYFTFIEGFLRPALNLLNISTVELILMMLDVEIELRLGVEVLITNVTLDQPTYSASLLGLHRLYLLFLNCTHHQLYIIPHTQQKGLQNSSHKNCQIIFIERMKENKEGKQNQWHPNRTYLALTNGIIVDSCFPGGNIATATIINNNPLTLELEGNTDVSMDNTSKYWLYFRLRGFRKDRPIKFILKNANHLRKYLGQNRYRPYMMVKQNDQNWQANSLPIDLSITQNGQLQGSFLYNSDKLSRLSRATRSTNQLYAQKQQKITSTTISNEQLKGDSYFAIAQPYNCQDLTQFIQNIRIRSQNNSNSNAYFNQQTITYSYERRKVSLITITASSNIESTAIREPIISEQIFPNPKQRPHKLKNNPVIIFTGRVHPSETASSFFIEGLIEFLLSDCKVSNMLRELFIFQIIPMLNPDGVEHGNFRFDHEMKNLNRYYGQSSISKTPSIRAAELLISYFKNRNNEQCQFTQFYEQTYSRLFMYVDVHAHSSAMPSFIYGNHSDRIEHSIQNKMFCKLIENNFVSGGFSRIESEFSKKNMMIQEKYDEFSKLCSGRVFAGRADSPEQNVFHSYTLEILPYWEELPRKKGDKTDKGTAAQYAKALGRQFLVSILDLLDLNPESKFNDSEMQKMRRFISKQCYNEQVRRAFLFRRAQSSSDRCSYTDITKMRQGLADKQIYFHNQYITRWFNNHIFLKHLSEKTQLLKQPKFYKFFQKITKIMLRPSSQTYESPKKEIKPQEENPFKSQQKKILCQTQPGCTEETDSSSPAIRTSKCFVSREEKRSMTIEERIGPATCKKERRRIETKINKHTIELRDQFHDLIIKHKTMEKQPGLRFPKREYAPKREVVVKKETAEQPERYTKDWPSKTDNDKNQNIFNIKIKQIIPKSKQNLRVQTESIPEAIEHSEAAENTKLNCSNSQTDALSLSNKRIASEQDTAKSIYHKPSFIQQFIIKIREEREGITNSKPNSREELKQKALKFRPTIREQLEQQDKSLLPVLRRNKIFTIISQPTNLHPKTNPYNCSIEYKKRAATLQPEIQIEQLISKTKTNKKQELLRQNIIKKTQQLIQNDFL